MVPPPQCLSPPRPDAPHAHQPDAPAPAVAAHQHRPGAVLTGAVGANPAAIGAIAGVMGALTGTSGAQAAAGGIGSARGAGALKSWGLGKGPMCWGRGLDFTVRRVRRPMTDEELDIARRGGRPVVYLIMGVIFLLIGAGVIAIGFGQLTDPWPGNDGVGWVGLAGGVLNTGAGVLTLFAWRRQRIEYREYRRIACHACGYDRRGLAAHAKCPECGRFPREV